MYRDGMMLTGLAVTVHGPGHSLTGAWEYAVAVIAMILVFAVRTYAGKAGSARPAGRWSWQWPVRRDGRGRGQGEDLAQQAASTDDRADQDRERDSGPPAVKPTGS